MIRLRLAALLLVALFAAGSSGCDAVVGANCAVGLDPCGPVCCASGYACAEDLTCVAEAQLRPDAGLLPPWPYPDAATTLDAGRVWPDGGDGGGGNTDGGDGGDGAVDGSDDGGGDDGGGDDGGSDAGVDGSVDADGGSDGGGVGSDGGSDAGVDASSDGGLDGATDGGPDAATDGGADAGPDATVDGSTDAGTDGGTDASTDGSVDAGPEAGVDAGADAGTDATVDGGTDAGADAGTDGGTDAGADGGTDGGTDAGADGGTDAGADAGPACPLGTLLCGSQCVNTDTSLLHCGGCNIACGMNEICNLGVCSPTCTAPRTQCPGACVDVQNDPTNCGTCGSTCGSGVCFAGGCVAASAGHVVVIGHDMRTIHPASYRLAGNSIFLPVQDPLEIGIFQETTSAGAIAGLDWVIRNSATDMGRSYNSQVILPTEVTLRLASVDVFVIFPQDGASDSMLTTWGSDWSLALRSFVRRGGTVVLFDAGGAHAGSWQILDSAGLFPASSRTTVAPGAMLDVTAPADAIARAAPLSYPAQTNTVTFTSTLTDVVVETRTPPGLPVIFHRVIFP